MHALIHACADVRLPCCTAAMAIVRAEPHLLCGGIRTAPPCWLLLHIIGETEESESDHHWLRARWGVRHRSSRPTPRVRPCIYMMRTEDAVAGLDVRIQYRLWSPSYVRRAPATNNTGSVVGLSCLPRADVDSGGDAAGTHTPVASSLARMATQLCGLLPRDNDAFLPHDGFACTNTYRWTLWCITDEWRHVSIWFSYFSCCLLSERTKLCIYKFHVYQCLGNWDGKLP